MAKKIINLFLSVLIAFTCITASNINVNADSDPIVGRLKIIARYDDSMNFYDGHCYLAFTSYIDNVRIPLDKVYAAYEISNQFYTDLGDVGSGQDSIVASYRYEDTQTYDYFELIRNRNTNLTDEHENYLEVNRGEIVTIGTSRDFDISIAQAAITTVMNSTLYGMLTEENKKTLLDAAKAYFNEGIYTLEGFKTALGNALESVGYDFDTKGFELVDGDVNGGVCLNRELYNQKYKYDQFSNATYEVEITQSELDRLIAAISSGKYNNYSLIVKSCAISCLGLWNDTFADREDLQLNIVANEQPLKATTPAVVKGAILNILGGKENPAEGNESCLTYNDQLIYVTVPSTYVNNIYYQSEGQIMVDTKKVRRSLVGICGNENLHSATVNYDLQVKYTKNNDSYTISNVTVNGKTANEGIYLTYNAGTSYKYCRIVNETSGEGTVLPVDSNGKVSFSLSAFNSTYTFIGINADAISDLGYPLEYGETGDVLIPGYNKCSIEEFNEVISKLGLTSDDVDFDSSSSYLNAEVTVLKVSDLDKNMQAQLPSNTIVFNIDLYKCYDLFDKDWNYLDTASANAKTQIHSVNDDSIAISIPLSDDQVALLGEPNSNYDYYMLREHNGVIDKLPCTYKNIMGMNTIIITSDRFSTYAIYKIKKETGNTSSDSRRIVVNTSTY